MQTVLTVSSVSMSTGLTVVLTIRQTSELISFGVGEGRGAVVHIIEEGSTNHEMFNFWNNIYYCLSSSIYLGRRPIYLITDVDLLKQVLVKDFVKFRNRGVRHVLLMCGLIHNYYKHLWIRHSYSAYIRCSSYLQTKFCTNETANSVENNH